MELGRAHGVAWTVGTLPPVAPPCSINGRCFSWTTWAGDHSMLRCLEWLWHPAAWVQLSAQWCLHSQHAGLPWVESALCRCSHPLKVKVKPIGNLGYFLSSNPRYSNWFTYAFRDGWYPLCKFWASGDHMIPYIFSKMVAIFTSGINHSHIEQSSAVSNQVVPFRQWLTGKNWKSKP